MKNMLDRYGQQLKSPKSKKLRGLDRDTLSSPVPDHFHLSLSCSQISLIILKLQQKNVRKQCKIEVHCSWERAYIIFIKIAPTLL